MAGKQVMVIGLGQLGMAVIRSLADADVEVLAVDRRPEAVQQVASLVSEALCFDATDEEALTRTSPGQRDVCICAIGDESREGAILVTALLRKLGAPRIIARATDDLLERILFLVGAHEVVNPESSFGQRLATRLLYEGILEVVPLGDELVISELRVPAPLTGRTLADLGLPATYGVTVLAIRRAQAEGRGGIRRPQPQSELREGDGLIVVAAPGAIETMLDRLGA
jgi:trk system potassium uptake protein TrkA